jgi:phosphatidylglycerophosphate synthase
LNKIINQIPIGLIYSRLILAFVIIFLSIVQLDYFKPIIVSIMIWAIVSDIFDGIIARKLNISTPRLRRLDSSVDQIFWICTLVGITIICPNFFIDNYIKIVIILALEVVSYLVSYLRFKKEVATHAILSKFWALTVLGTLIKLY